MRYETLKSSQASLFCHASCRPSPFETLPTSDAKLVVICFLRQFNLRSRSHNLWDIGHCFAAMLTFVPGVGGRYVSHLLKPPKFSITIAPLVWRWQKDKLVVVISWQLFLPVQAIRDKWGKIPCHMFNKPRNHRQSQNQTVKSAALTGGWRSGGTNIGV